MYGFEYLTASSDESLSEAYSQLWQQNDKPVLLEVFTPTIANNGYLNDYFAAIQ
jgi:2-succinyl-5-enolpyruvyl-6-hydroxy-3-cyclohexene-1-carboxylate synthase